MATAMSASLGDRGKQITHRATLRRHRFRAHDHWVQSGNLNAGTGFIEPFGAGGGLLFFATHTGIISNSENYWLVRCGISIR